jgi:hypothetical protein
VLPTERFLDEWWAADDVQGDLAVRVTAPAVRAPLPSAAGSRPVGGVVAAAADAVARQVRAFLVELAELVA